MAELVIKIVTLQGVSLEEEVAMITLPAWDGEVGLLPMHASFIFKLHPGVVKLYKENGSVAREIQIEGGFARVYENSVSIVTNLDV